MTTPQNAPSKPVEKNEPLIDRSIFYLWVLPQILLLLSIPVYMFLYPFNADERWGTEAEAVGFAEQQIREQLGWTGDREIKWTTGPKAVMEKLEPPLDERKRLWKIAGSVAVEDATQVYQISCCKEETWLPVQRIVDNRTEFSDEKILERTLSPTEVIWQWLWDYIIEPLVR